jgi:WD40 repeat protein
MINLKNENILKLIIISFSLKQLKYILDHMNNRILRKILSENLDYDKLFKFLGNIKITLEETKDYMLPLSLLGDNNLTSALKNKSKLWKIKNNFQDNDTLKYDDTITSAIYHPDGNIISITWNGKVKVWDVKNNYNCIRSVSLGKYWGCKSLLLTNDNCLACTARLDKRYLILMIEPINKTIKEITGHNDLISGLVNINSNKFASASWDSTIRVWDSHCKHLKTLFDNKCKVLCLVYVNKDNILLTGNNDKFIKVWRMQDYLCVRIIEAHADGVSSLLLLPCGFLASGSYCEGNIKLWNLRTYQCINMLTGHRDEICSLLYLKGSKICSASCDNRVIIWGY